MAQKQKNKPYIPTEEDIITDCVTYNLPRAVVEEIYSLKRDWDIGFIKSYYIRDYHTYDEYHLMFKAVSDIFLSKNLIGRSLPKDDERSIKINNFLAEMGVSIQFHPYYGMIIVDENYDTER